MQKSKIKNQNYPECSYLWKLYFGIPKLHRNNHYARDKLKFKNIFKNSGFLILILIFAFCIFNFSGCASAPYVKPISPPGIPGIYHRVEKGETLWRISKLYNVDLEKIAKVNHISDTTNIEANQLIFIPNRQKQLSMTNRHPYDDFIWPVRGKVITTFGQTFNNMINKGINIQPYNNSDIVSARSGKVIFYKNDFGYFGKTLIIDHGDGFLTVYARNSQVFIKAGDNVGKGMVIAKAGSAGKDKNTYLHFEIRKGHVPQNPFFYLPR